MPFSHRVFCRLLETPSLSELLVWLRQQGYAAKISGAASGEDLLSCYWTDVHLDAGEQDGPFHLRCLRGQQPGPGSMQAEVADFVADVRELPVSPASQGVMKRLLSTRSLLIIEFPPGGASARSEEAAEAMAALFVERASGLAHRDGVGFLDEDDDVVLALG